MLHQLRLHLFIAILTLSSLFATTGGGYGAEAASSQPESASTHMQIVGEYLKAEEQLTKRTFDNIEVAPVT